MQARAAFDNAKLKASGFAPPNPTDNSETGCITKFEATLPLGKISLLEFERRLKKLIDPRANDCISKKQIIECFKDHNAFKDIEDENSLTHALLTDKVFLSKKEEEGYYIPYLVLLGLLYCASNARVRSEKFFELCQIDLDPHLSHNDKEFVDYFPKLLQISFELMVHLYGKFKPQDMEEPNADWTLDPQNLKDEYEDIFSQMVDELFDTSSKLENERFINMMEK